MAKKRTYNHVVRNPAWKLEEDLLLWPLICSAQSFNVYNDICTKTCQELNRVPHSGTPEKAKSKFQVRAITYGPTNQIKGLIEFADRMFLGTRTGMPLTWGEKVRILYPYRWKKADPEYADTELITIDDILVLMDRDESDRPAVAEYLDGIQITTEVAVDKTSEGVGNIYAKSPYVNAAGIKAIIGAWLKNPIQARWREVLEYLDHYGSVVPEVGPDEEPPTRR